MIALAYHETTKHDFNRFARSLGYLDWATQPDPFRRYPGAPLIALPRDALAGAVAYAALYERTAAPMPVTAGSIAEFLRCSMGLSAWKQYEGSRWALRVNPSSGNLHPTEAYIVHEGRVCHYAPREHALEERCVLDPDRWRALTAGRPGFLVAPTSIFWREAWKYGERAFRYCQHDTGHAIAALRLSAAMLGWTMTLLPRWSDAQIAAVLGIDRDADYADAEREDAECIAIVTPGDPSPWLAMDPQPLVEAARSAQWAGAANQLSPAHVEWPIIEEVAAATRRAGGVSEAGRAGGAGKAGRAGGASEAGKASGASEVVSGVRTLPAPPAPHASPAPLARRILLQRRSAVAFDARSSLPRVRFMRMLDRLQPHGSPWDAIDWPPQVHLLLFVHRVEGLIPGVYAYFRDASTQAEWRDAMRPDFLWEPIANDPDDSNGSNVSNDRLFLLLPTDVTWPANRASCDQDIAGDGFFSLGMIARFESSIRERGEWFYRRLFWESGVIGQVLYLEAEAAGARATGIGCFYDDAVHDLAGLSGVEWQSLYHFSMGMPADDARLTTQPGYPWEGK